MGRRRFDGHVGRLAGREILEEGGGALLERRRGALFLLLARHGFMREPRLFGFRGSHCGDFGGHGVGGGDLSGGAPAAHRSRLDGDGRGRRLRGFRGAAALGRSRGLLLLALFALPARTHQRHLLVLDRRQVTTHEDVHLLEHAHELLAGDAELSR